MDGVPRIFTVAPVPQVMVVGQEDLRSAFQKKMYSHIENSSRCHPGTGIDAEFPLFWPLALSFWDTHVCISTMIAACNSVDESPQTTVAQSRSSLEYSDSLPIHEINGGVQNVFHSTEAPNVHTQTRVNPSQSCSPMASQYPALQSGSHTISDIDMDQELRLSWFQHVSFETPAALLLLLDFRDVSLPSFQPASLAFLSQFRAKKKSVARESYDFGDAFRKIIAYKQSKQSEYNFQHPPLLIVLVFNGPSANVGEKEDAALAPHSVVQELVTEFKEEICALEAAKNDSTTMEYSQSPCDSHAVREPFYCVDINTTCIGVVGLTDHSIETIYLHLKEMCSSFFESLLAKETKPLVRPEVKDKRKSNMEFQHGLRVAFLSEYLQDVRRSVNLYTELWSSLLDLCSLGLLQTSFLKALCFVFCRRMLWLCQSPQTRYRVEHSHQFLTMLQKCVSRETHRSFIVKLWEFYSTAITSLFTNAYWITAHSCIVYLNEEMFHHHHRARLCSSNCPWEKSYAMQFNQFQELLALQSSSSMKRCTLIGNFEFSLQQSIKALMTFSQTLQCFSMIPPAQRQVSPDGWYCGVLEYARPRASHLHNATFEEKMILHFSQWILQIVRCSFHNWAHLPRGLILMGFVIARFILQLRCFAEGLSLLFSLAQCVVKTCFALNSCNPEAGSLDVAEYSIHNQKASGQNVAGFYESSHTLSMLYAQLLTTAAVLLHVEPHPTLCYFFPKDDLATERIADPVKPLISQIVHSMLARLDIVCEAQCVARCGDIGDLSTIVAASIHMGVLGLFDSNAQYAAAPTKRRATCLQFSLSLRNWLLMLASEAAHPSCSTVLQSSSTVKTIALPSRYCLKSLTCVLSSHVLADEAQCCLVVFHVLDICLWFDSIRVITCDQQEVTFPAVACLCSSSTTPRSAASWDPHSICLRPHHPVLFRFVLQPSQPGVVSWSGTLQHLDFHCTALGNAHNVDVWVSSRLMIPVQDAYSFAKTLTLPMDSIQAHLWPSFHLYCVYHNRDHLSISGSGSYPDVFRLNHPFYSLDPHAVVHFATSQVFHFNTSLTSLFFSFIPPKALYPYVTTYSSGSQPLSNGTTVILRPFPALLTPCGSLQLNFPNTALSSFIQRVDIKLSNPLFVNAMKQFIVLLTYRALSHPLSFRIHVTSQLDPAAISVGESDYRTSPFSSTSRITVYGCFVRDRNRLDVTPGASLDTAYLCGFESTGTPFKLPMDEEAYHHVNDLRDLDVASITKKKENDDTSSLLIVKPRSEPQESSAHDKIFQIAIPCCVESCEPGRFLLNVSIAVEYNNNVVDLTSKSEAIQVDIPFSTSPEFISISSPEFLDPRTFFIEATQHMTSSAGSIPLSPYMVSLLNRISRRWLKISFFNLSDEPLTVYRLTLWDETPNGFSATLSTRDPIFSNVESSHSTLDQLHHEPSRVVVPSKHHWSCLIQFDHLVRCIKSKRNACHETQASGAVSFNDIIEALRINLEYSSYSIGNINIDGVMDPQRCTTLLSKRHMFTERLSRHFDTLLSCCTPVKIFTYHVSCAVVGVPFRLYATVVNMAFECMAFSFQLRIDSTAQTFTDAETHPKTRVPPFFIGGLLESSLFLAPESLQHLSWTLLALRPGTFSLPQLVLTKLGPPPLGLYNHAQTLSLSEILDQELTETRKSSTHEPPSEAYVITSPVSDMTVLPCAHS